MNSWGYGKPKMAAWLFLAPWHFFSLCISSSTIVHLDWTSFNCHLVWVMNMSFAVCMFSWWVEDFPCHKAPYNGKLLGNVFPVGVHLPQSPLHWANHMNFGGQPCKLGIITDSITLNYQAKSRELIEKLDSSRTSLITWDWVNWWEGLQFYDIFIWNIADF